MYNIEAIIGHISTSGNHQQISECDDDDNEENNEDEDAMMRACTRKKQLDPLSPKGVTEGVTQHQKKNMTPF